MPNGFSELERERDRNGLRVEHFNGTPSSNSKYNPSEDYQTYLQKAKYYTNSDCLSGQKRDQRDNDRSYQERLLQSIEKKALRDLNGGGNSFNDNSVTLRQTPSKTGGSSSKSNNFSSALGSAKKAASLNDSSKKVLYQGDGEDGMKSKRHADILRDRIAEGVKAPTKDSLRVRNNDLIESYQNFTIKHDIVKPEESNLNQSPSAEKSKI